MKTLLLALAFLPVTCFAAELRLPAGWKTTPALDPRMKLVATHNNDAGAMIIEFQKADVEGKSLEETLKSAANGLLSQPSCTNVSQVKKVRVGTLEGAALSFDIVMADQQGVKIPSRYEAYVFPHNQVCYLVTFSARTKSYTKYQGEFAKIIQTFRP